MSEKLILSCTVNSSESDQELLTLLSERFPYRDNGQWLQCIEAGQVLLNGRQAAPTQLVCPGDALAYTIPDHREPPVETRFETILETPELLLVGKPAGTPVTRTGLIIRNTFVNILRRHYEQEIHPLHRLDRETSGLLLCARSRELCRRYQPDLKKTMTGKLYLAVIKGHLDQQTITVDQPLATREDSPVRCRMWVSDHGKPCRTVFHIVAVAAEYTLLAVELRTGRRHQIRAHLAHLDHPLVGDKIYAHDGRYYLKRLEKELSEEDYRLLGARAHTLHAWAVRLKLPDRPEKHYLSRIFSPDMQQYLQLFPAWQKQATRLLQSLL